MQPTPTPQLNADSLDALDAVTGGVVASEGLLAFLETPGNVSDATRERLGRQLASDKPHVRTTAVKVLRDLKRSAEHRRPANTPQPQPAAPLAQQQHQPAAGFVSKREFHAAQAEARKKFGHWKHDPAFMARLQATPASITRI